MMKRAAILRTLLLGVLVSGPLQAECHYFRVNFKLLKCAEWKEKDPGSGAQDLGDEGDIPQGPVANVKCSCDYSLSGSDPRCDFDQTVEQSSIRGAENVKEYCARGKSICRDVCSANLP